MAELCMTSSISPCERVGCPVDGDGQFAAMPLINCWPTRGKNVLMDGARAARGLVRRQSAQRKVLAHARMLEPNGVFAEGKLTAMPAKQQPLFPKPQASF